MNDAPSEPQRDYRDTVFLPQTGFPMRGDLPRKEPQILARWEKMDLWSRLRAASRERPKFILHDGPPYANGNIHIGTALNKIHKDVINRTRQMAGYDADYIPGWDCHGLPIEWKIEEDYRARKKDKDAVPVLQFRAECRAYAEHWLAVQMAEFRRLGVEGAWRERYATMDHSSEAAIAGEICKFLLNGALIAACVRYCGRRSRRPRWPRPRSNITTIPRRRSGCGFRSPPCHRKRRATFGTHRS
jgi:isoleucyl-tRNA synthetase